MTNKTQPEALRLALSIDLMDTFTNYQQEELNKAAAELRRLHVENERLSGLCDKWNSECDEFREDNKRLAALVEAQQHTRIAELEAQLEAVGAGGVQAFSAAPVEVQSPWSRALEIRMAQGWKLKGDRVPVLYTDSINGEGVGRDDLWLCTTKALAASPTPPAEQQAEESLTKLLAECRDAFPIPEPGSPLEVQWSAAMARPEEVPEYVRLCVAAMQAAPKAAPVKACVCGEPQSSGTVHRVDGPCYVAAPQQEAQEPVMIYHGRCTIDCGEHGHHDIEMLRMIPAGSKLYTAPQPAPAAAAGPSLQHLHDLLYTAQRTTGDAQAQAIAEARSWPKVSGVSRDEGHSRALLVFFAAEPTDDEVRAVHDTLAAQPAPLSDDAKDAARYRWLREGNDAKHGAAWHVAVNLYGCEWDAAIDAALAAQKGKL